MKKNKDWLINIRKQKGMTQKELADALGISINTLAKIEQGQRSGSDSTWMKIINLFGEYEDLMKISEENILTFFIKEKFNISQIVIESHEVIFRQYMDKNFKEIVNEFITIVNSLKENKKVYLYIYNDGKIIKGIYVIGGEDYFRIVF
ncbi:helix-turn-helix transcriptional regulator [uncultured Clostridium sp.]|uniref:helix-turn-helix domain-containing protein n=1 Tax=uncultured Clostridium sp. TaxID=59620 RepID=UPI0025DFB21F|nr:helix-turn-helix transcriptional regulator [uncultured Clostridium sp.]